MVYNQAWLYQLLVSGYGQIGSSPNVEEEVESLLTYLSRQVHDQNCLALYYAFKEFSFSFPDHLMTHKARQTEIQSTQAIEDNYRDKSRDLYAEDILEEYRNDDDKPLRTLLEQEKLVKRLKTACRCLSLILLYTGHKKQQYIEANEELDERLALVVDVLRQRFGFM